MSIGKVARSVLRLISGSQLEELGTYARREAKLTAIAVAGFLAALTCALGAAALCFALIHTVLAPRIGALASLAALTGVCLAFALLSTLVGVHAGRSLAEWPRLHRPVLPAARLRAQTMLSGSESDEVVVLLLSAVLEDLLRPGRRRR